MKFGNHLRSVSVMAALALLLLLHAGIGDAVEQHSSAAAPAQVRLYEAAQVSGPDIRLKQIAEIISSDGQQAEKIGRLVIAKSPLPGRSRNLRNQYVQLRLRQFGFDTRQVTLTGAPATKVTARSVEVSAEEVRGIAEDYVRKADLWAPASVTIADVQVGPDRLFPPGRLTYRVVSPQGMKKTGMMRLSVHFDVDGWYQKTVPVVVRIDVMAAVVVARRPIGRYRPITEKDLTLQRLDLTDLPAHIYTDINEVIGKRARRKILANTVVRHDMIETPPLVRRGSMVMIIAESGGLKITALGEVKTSGYRGQRVKVVNLDSRKNLYARVVDENTVKVEF